MVNKLLIFGHGQLGEAYDDWFSKKETKVEVAKVDIRDARAVNEAVEKTKPDVILNAAAKTSIDWCALNREEAFAVNTLGADNLAAAAAQTGAYLVHISSGCIQESTSAEDVKTEEDEPHPVCFYSWTKVWAEDLIRERMRREGLHALILRPRQLLSTAASPRNALVKFLTYKKFIQTPQSCTIVDDLLDVTGELIERKVEGVYNVVNPGVITPFEIADLLRQHVQPELKVVTMTKDDLNAITQARRIDAVLSTEKLKTMGIDLKNIKDRLIEILPRLKVNLSSAEGLRALEITREETAAKLSAKV